MILEYTRTMGAVAQPQSYLFSNIDWAPPSAYDRKSYIKLNGEQKLYKSLTGKGSIGFLYFDKGRWYNDNYYGISEKKPELSFLGALNLSPTHSLTIEAGIEAKGVDYYYWSPAPENKHIKTGRSYLVTPYGQLTINNLPNIDIKAVIKRSIDKGIGDADDYWDFTFTLMRGF